MKSKVKYLLCVSFAVSFGHFSDILASEPTPSLTAESSTFSGADSEAGEKMAKTVCLACHGVDGLSANSLWPNIRGQKFDYMVKQLHEFRSGVRSHPLMTPISQTLKDDDILNLSKYYSSLQN